jgi:hypothetical protein
MVPRTGSTCTWRQMQPMETVHILWQTPWSSLYRWGVFCCWLPEYGTSSWNSALEYGCVPPRWSDAPSKESVTCGKAQVHSWDREIEFEIRVSCWCFVTFVGSRGGDYEDYMASGPTIQGVSFWFFCSFAVFDDNLYKLARCLKITE